MILKYIGCIIVAAFYGLFVSIAGGGLVDVVMTMLIANVVLGGPLPDSKD